MGRQKGIDVRRPQGAAHKALWWHSRHWGALKVALFICTLFLSLLLTSSNGLQRNLGWVP